MTMHSFYSLNYTDSKGNLHSMKEHEGKVILIVNTATRCGLAPQFEELETIYQDYKEKGVVVLGFPCDQFNHQEPETNDSMVEVCKINFGVTFPLSEKIEVNGSGAHPVFSYLKKKKRGFMGSAIKWNFTKFLVDQNGRVLKRFSPTTSPKAIVRDIENLIE